ncbi:hypothetical protein GCM10011613_28670 [Cellvibrio zantedeschiae]|uniref:Glycosyl transferase family 1 domain-containing protein n=2 Tax=Cellvibrio zantedeschiae TaxID=1237077 RepID=A0ABQ3BB93_9GAMM|nr:hypothetical protein GCM10011613_28670 [Cellvibrio zantedeschiae]
MIHCEQFTGYAIGTLEQVFFNAAIDAGYAQENIFWSYPKVVEANTNIIECQFKSSHKHNDLKAFIVQNNIQQVLAFDLGYPANVLPVLRSAGVKSIISYWGASMSSLNSGVKLLYKKIEWLMRSHKPDFFIFESAAMQLTATKGRGIPKDKTAVVALGVDTEKFFPSYQDFYYAHESLAIPSDRKIVFYSGHMEERKGVRVIMQAAIELVDQLQQEKVHFVICGNKNNEADVYQDLLAGTQAKNHVTFAGYRNDIAELMRSASVGVIASTGWDSFTMSSVEMMASGLPLIVSNLQGLGETIEHNANGFHIEPGDSHNLAKYINELIINETLAKRFSLASRARAESLFSKKLQTKLISTIIARLATTLKNGSVN